MTRILILAAAASAALCAPAKTTVYRLELVDEVPYVVGQDGVRREVALVDPVEWAQMKADVEGFKRGMNATAAGREQLHGKRVHTFVDDKERVKTTVYQDGYQYVERLPVPARARAAVVQKDKPKADAPKSGYNGRYSKKYVELLEERARRKGVRQAVLEHDAATGKDTVK